ncbi:hypothetical protein H1R20_g6050, partial [Candolleomyces eurysporus]
MPCGHQREGRNLILCIDGTANQFGTKNTNVIELYNLILKKTEHRQRTWYNSGIGTYAQPHWRSLSHHKQVLTHKIDLAIAWNFEKILQAAYRWLSDNYKDGDCIFLFGFSRGAFQVRALSAMIEKVGLIYRGNEMQIPFAYQLYADPNSGKKGYSETTVTVGSEEQVSMAERFKKAFSHPDVRVHFVGAWDTVSSIGVARGKQTLPGTTDGMTHVCYFRHALALDERRVKFLPEYAWGGSALGKKAPGSPALDGERCSPEKDTAESNPQILEVWFAGSHSDIGGGNVRNVGMNRSRPPMRWMVLEATAVGLRTKPFERELLSHEQIEVKESLKGVWHLFELLPFQRLTFTRRSEGSEITRKPHLWSNRKIHDGQKIHSSLILAGPDSRYVPKASPPGNNSSVFWNQLRDAGLGNRSGWLEIDLVDSTRTIVKRLLEGNEDVLNTLDQIAKDKTGAQIIYDEVIRVLRSEPKLEADTKALLLSSTIEILKNSLNLKFKTAGRIHPWLQNLLESKSDQHRQVAETFLVRFTELRKHEPLVHAAPVRSIGISADGQSVFSASGELSIRTWDMGSGKQMEPTREHANWVPSVAISISCDGKRIVSSSYDHTIRIWDAETGQHLGDPLLGHTDDVWSLAFSPDGKHIVSGSSDKTIRIWDATTGEAISADGKLIVAGGVGNSATSIPDVIQPPCVPHNSYFEL